MSVLDCYRHINKVSRSKPRRGRQVCEPSGLTVRCVSDAFDHRIERFIIITYYIHDILHGCHVCSPQDQQGAYILPRRWQARIRGGPRCKVNRLDHLNYHSRGGGF